MGEDELRALLWAIVQEGAAAQPGPDGLPNAQIQAKMRKMASAAQGQSAALSITDQPEFAYGTEPPGEGWEYCGQMKWRRIRQVLQSDLIDLPCGEEE